MHDCPTLVIPLRTTGLAGDPAGGAMPPVFPLVPLSEALSTPYRFDAMLTMYRIEGETRMPRLNKSALAYLRGKGAKVVADKVLIDVDNPEHRAWQSDDQIAAAYAKVKATRLGATAGFYATRAGYRLIWRLAQPLDVGLLDSYLVQLIAALAAEGIEADPACCDWTRLFRAPFATREGADAPLDLPFDFEVGVLDFAPSELTESRTPALDTTIGADWPHQPPAPCLPGPEDGLPLKAVAKELYSTIRKGAPIAAPGARRETIMRAIGILAHGLEEPDPFTIYRTLSASVVAAYAQTGIGRSKDEALFDLWRAAKSMAAITLTQKRSDQATLDHLADVARRKREAAGTAEQLEPGATVPGQAPPLDAVLFTAADQYYVIDTEKARGTSDGFYHGPFKSSAVPAMLERYAPQVFRAKKVRNDKGTLISLPELLTRCGGEVKAVHAHSGKRGITYDPINKTLHEGVGAVRADITARFDPVIHEWLCILGGEQRERLLDWLATYTLVEFPTCGLYLHAEPGVGKNLFVEGLASVYGTAPTMYASIIGTHNDAIASCPVVFADEEIPASSYGRTPTAIFRVIIGSSSHALRRMYQPAATFHGCLRLVVAANNLDALRIHEDLTIEDFAAIRQRILYIRVDGAAGEYLRSIGGRQATQDWITGDRFARHLLWLRDNRAVTPGPRFLVEGGDSPLLDRLGASSGITSAVIETIAFAISEKAGQVPLEGFLLGNGVIYVSTSAIFDAWEKAHGPTAKALPKARVVSALRRLAVSDGLVTVPYESGGLERDLSAWQIRPKEVLQAITDYGFGGTERVQRDIAKALPWR